MQDGWDLNDVAQIVDQSSIPESCSIIAKKTLLIMKGGVKMKILEKGKIILDVFKLGMKDQVNQEWVWGLSTLVGINQGTKYKGSVKNGLLAGGAVIGCITVVNGVRTVIKNWASIKQQF